MKHPNNRKMLLFFLFFPFVLIAQNISTIVTDTWQQSAWEPATRTLHEYQGDNLLLATNQLWDDGMLAWTNSSRFTYVYNPDNTVAEMDLDVWNEAWEPTSRVIYTYTGFAKVASATSEFYAAGLWMPISRVLSTYDGNEFLINELNQNWDFIGNAFADSSQVIYTNNPNGSIDNSVTQIYNVGTDLWDNEFRNSYEYNASGGVLTLLTETWEAGTWVNSELSTSTYDGNPFLIQMLQQEWNVAGSEWIDVNQQLITNTSSGLPQQIISQTWNGDSWDNQFRITYTYENLGIIENPGSSFMIFPNPSTNIVTINATNISVSEPYDLLDISGKAVMHGIINVGQTQIDASGLESGVYILRMGRRAYKLVKI